MKKLYSSLLAIALCGMTAGAATVNVAADGLKAAVDAAADGDVLVLTADQTLTDRLSFPQKTLTIQGQTADIKIVRDCNKMALIANSGADITFKDLTIEGGNYSPNAYFMEISGNGSAASKAVFDNVTFANCASSGTYGTIQIKQSGAATFTNCKFTNCTVGENSANIFVGNNNVTVGGTTSASLYLERRITAAADYSGNCEVWLKPSNFSVGANVVLNATKGFTLKGYEADYSLQPNGSNLALAYNKTIVRNEATGAGYSTLTAALDAMTAPEEGQPEVTVLTVLENAEASKRVGPFGFPVSIKGEGEGVTITRTFGSAFFISNGAAMSFENLTLDGADKGGKDYEVEVNQNNATLAFTDVTIVNSGAPKGIFTVKDGNRVLALNNVTATVAEGKVGVNLNGKLQLSGNNNVSVLMANAGAKISVTGELTNTTPISISYADGIAIVKDQVVVNGCTDPTKFKLVHDDLVLVAKDGNLVAGDSTSSSIDEIEATEAGIVNVYSLQGVVLKEGVEASKATEGLAPGLYIVGGKKIAVR